MEMKATIQQMNGNQQQKNPQDRLPGNLLIAAIAAQLPCAWHANVGKRQLCIECSNRLIGAMSSAENVRIVQSVT